MTSADEPKQLRRGKAFHKRVQADWERDAAGNVQPEHTIALLGKRNPVGRRRRGRLDIFVDDTEDYVVVVEIKATDWDRIKPRNITRNLGSHARQVWKYVERFHIGDGIDVCAGIIYPTAPKTAGLKARIEEYLNDRGMQVVWYDD